MFVGKLKRRIVKSVLGLLAIICVVSVMAMSVTVSAEENLLAFPGAVGGGKYTTGARGDSNISVYHVTNLNKSGAGSFADAVSQSGRIIVFDVSGTIEISGTLKIKKSNLTILGQTAPGDGVTISGGDLLLDSGVENVIIRYLRVRPTDKNGGEPDGLGGRYNKNIIFDHCSLSWSVDELITLYAGSTEDTKNQTGRNITVQNIIASESLAMSSHVKGKHGYGGIIGGTNYTFYNNLMAHHDSRSPRLDRELGSTDIANNIIYNWGQTNSLYGAESYSIHNKTQTPSNVNIVSNYYMYGPSTKSNLRTRIFDVSNDAKVKPYSNFYVNGNYVFGSQLVTADNKKGLNNSSLATVLESPVDMGEYSVPYSTPEEAYDKILSDAGASLPKRDAIDARIVDDVKHQTGRIINNADEIAGLIPTEEIHRTFEIPEDWKAENNMGSASETDIVENGKYKGYTWIEAYVNDWTAKASKPANPEIVVMSPAIASVNKTVNGLTVNNGNWTVVEDTETVNYHAAATPVQGTEITKFELYDKNQLLKTYNSAEINDDISLEPGVHHLTSRAYNSNGEKTQSTTAIVYVVGTAEPGSFSYTQIGKNCSFNNLASATMDNNGVYTISGSGQITTNSSDKCAYMYKEVKGDFDIIVKVKEIPKFENKQVSGIMFRESLEPNSRMLMLADGWEKYGENVSVFVRNKAGSSSTRSYFKNASGSELVNGDKYDTGAAEYHLPKYLRMKRSGDKLTMSVSDSGIDFTDNPRQPMSFTIDGLSDTVYLGIANDSAQGTSVKEYYSMAKYSDISINGVSDVQSQESKVPFLDEEFDLNNWYGEYVFNDDKRSEPISGNSGYLLSTWSNANRNFTAQSKGIVTASFDFLEYGDNNKIGSAEFILRGTNADNELKEMIKVIAERDQTFKIGDKSIGDLVLDMDVWYNVSIELNFFTGKAKVSVYPYTEYDSAEGKYIISENGAEAETDFDKSYLLRGIRFVRNGGTMKYYDNVSVSAERNESYVKENNGKMDVFAMEDAKIYVAWYDKDGVLINVETYDITQNEEMEFDLPKLTNGVSEKAEVFLWNNNQEPLCEQLTVE